MIGSHLALGPLMQQGAPAGFALDAAIMALGPVGYWKMLDTGGTIATDDSGNGRNGSYAGQTLAAAAGGDGRLYATFNGTTAHSGVVVPVDLITPVWEITSSGAGISAFVLANVSAFAVTDPQIIGVTNGTAGSAMSWRVRVFDGTRPAVSSYTGGGTARQRIAATAPQTVFLNQWQSYVGTIASTSAFPDLYVDGVAPTTTTSGASTATAKNVPLRIAHQFGTNGRVTGAFGHAAVFPFVLSGVQIAGLHTAAAADGWSL